MTVSLNATDPNRPSRSDETLSLTEQLAGWLLAQKRTGIPAATIERARGYLLDWLGSALAGHGTEPGRQLLDYAAEQPSGTVPVVGSEMARGADVATLVNGGLSHIVEMDDLDRGSVVHPAAVVMPAALAAAKQTNASGRELLSAIVAGYEVAIRIGEAVGKEHYFYFHNTSTCGVFGAAAAAGWILGLTQQQMVWALGNAGTQAGGLWQFNADGAMSKHLHAGRAAANGHLAATLAAKGFTGARGILEGPRGFFAATAPDARPEHVVDGLKLHPDAYRLQGVSIKPYASCRHTHAAIDAALAIRPQLHDRPVETVLVETYQAALNLCDNAQPSTPYAAKFSLQYCIASALQRGSVGLEAFQYESIHDPDLRAFLPRVTGRANAVYDAHYPQAWQARVEVRLEDGSELSHTVTAPKGDPENPMAPTELETKFRRLAAFGGHEEQSETWLRWVAALAHDEGSGFPRLPRPAAKNSSPRPS